MYDNEVSNVFNNIFPKYIKDDFLFPLDNYRLFLDGLSINPKTFFETWSDLERQSLIEKYWKINTKLDWKWSLTFPLFTLLEKYIDDIENPKIIGFSGLPGSGKSTLGYWIDNVAKDLGLDIKVISLDDFYLPAREMDIAMNGNPWNVPRGYPGSHSVELLNQSLDTFLNTGVLSSPTFDKSLRDGKGDRSGWYESSPLVLILEGWFVGCEPISNSKQIDDLFNDELNLSLNLKEKDYRRYIQDSLSQYRKIWEKFDKIWHLKSSKFNNTIQWKTQQEEEMIKLKGSGLSDNRLTDFIRMIQTCIPQQSLSSINADTIIEIDQNRRINNLYTSPYFL